MDEKKRVQISLECDTFAKIKAIAHAEKRSPSRQIGYWIYQFIELYEKEHGEIR